MEWDHTQLILIEDLRNLIERMKSEGARYEDIRAKCIEVGRKHWLVTDEKKQNDAIGAALYLYAFDDKMREEFKKLKEALSESGVQI